MIRQILMASLVAVGMSSCTVAVLAGAPGAVSHLAAPAAVVAAR